MHEDELADGAVEHDAEVEFAIDGRGLLNQQPLHLLALRASLVGDELHTENLLDVQVGVFAVLRHLHAAALPRPPGVNLRLHHHAAGALGKQLAGHRGRLFRSVGHFAPRNGHAVFGQDLFRLILVNLHWIGTARNN